MACLIQSQAMSSHFSLKDTGNVSVEVPAALQESLGEGMHRASSCDAADDKCTVVSRKIFEAKWP